jgi:hypothetical protein
MGFLFGRAGRLTAKNGGFRPGQRLQRGASARPKGTPELPPLPTLTPAAELPAGALGGAARSRSGGSPRSMRPRGDAGVRRGRGRWEHPRRPSPRGTEGDPDPKRPRGAGGRRWTAAARPGQAAARQTEATLATQRGGESDWRAAVDPASGHTYYSNARTQEWQWHKPAQPLGTAAPTLSYRGDSRRWKAAPAVVPW